MKRKLLLVSIIFAQWQCAMGQSAYINTVFEYCPAPGQFVNTMPKYETGDDATSMAKKCTDLIANNAGGMITLGAYGGYVIFGFDHKIANVVGSNDFYIKGNAFAGSAEPGIVMVSQDSNGNGLPDDVWYELSGSADVECASDIVYGYQITYKYDALNNVPWTDNQGGEGTVERNNFHKQEYFPLWLTDELTFTGTLLPSNITMNGSNYVLNAFSYGYADNQPNTSVDGCSFDISNAVEPISRKSISLNYIDFVKVYSAMNQMAGWLGETSTEVCGAHDLHPDAEIEMQTNITQSTQVADWNNSVYFDMYGRQLIGQPTKHGVYIQVNSLGQKRKINL